ncbi:MAG: hypothetical protein LBB43_03275 [Spirochaetaceae bacterium]|jgi:hypothetical protein|nr:hypothetical protein [Spirochaetaceae bacterium]
MKKGLWLAALMSALNLYVYAQVSSSTNLTLQLSSLPEAKLNLNQSWILPILQGNGALTKGNSLKLSANADLTPIDTNLTLDAVLTPIAFLQFGLGAKIGSGWNIDLFGKPLYGIGISKSGTDGKQVIVQDKAFGGLFWNVHGNVLFQFDLAAVLPGDWNHIVFQTKNEINYKAFTAARDGQSWVYEHDFAENQNGWNYYGMFLLGYQPPIFLNTIGLMAEVDNYLYNTAGGDQWGDDRDRWVLSLLTNFTITKNLTLALIGQMRTMPNYTAETKDLYYRKRILDKEEPIRFEPYRIALILSAKLF